MQVTDYTSYDEVRAALGISTDELEDVTIGLGLYAEVLQMELEDINVNIPSTYTTVKGLITRTEAQDRFLQAAHLFATYAVAKQLSISLPLFSPEQITDGKAAIKRFTQDTPYAKVIDSVAKEYSRFRIRLDQLFSVVNSTSSKDVVAKVYLSISSPSSNPITGS